MMLSYYHSPLTKSFILFAILVIVFSALGAPILAQGTGETSTVMVIDLSGSMNDPESSGQAKLVGAKSAAQLLLQAIQQESTASETVHQAGLVTFSHVASVQSGLTTDMNGLMSLVQGMWADGGTNIGDGLYKGLDVLASAPAGTDKFIILLSDGLPNEGLETPQQFLDGPVARATSMGVCIHTIGFGQGGEMNADLLRIIAEGSGCGRFYLASEAFELRKIYVRLRHETMGDNPVVWEDTIRQGEEKIIGLYPVPDNQELLDMSLVWPGSSVIIKARDPNSVPVNANYPGAQVFDDIASQRILVQNPIPGTWQMGAEGLEVPEGEIPISLAASSRAMTVINTPTAVPATVTPVPPPTATSMPPTLSPPTPTPTITTQDEGGGMFWLFLLGAALVAGIAFVVFSARRKRAGSTSSLTVVSGAFSGHRFEIHETPYYIGRSKDNNLVLNAPEISRRHAVIRLEKGVYYVDDLNSQMGTLVNGQRIRTSPLRNNDQITLGGISIVFRSGS